MTAPHQGTADVGSRAPDSTLVVSEVFGPTFQGEGASIGRRAGFVRLGRCNLACTWCDTPYTWDWSRFDPSVELTRRTTADIAEQVEAMAVPLVVITGGEPLLQQSHLAPLLARLRRSGHDIEIETAGTIAPAPDIATLVDRFNVSPKLANSGNDRGRRYRRDVLSALGGRDNVMFKFVVSAASDLEEVAAIVVDCALDPARVWVMPEGTTAEIVIERGRALADEVLRRGWHLTTRLHVLLWGDERAR